MAKHSALAGISLLNKNNRLTGFNKQNINLNFWRDKALSKWKKVLLTLISTWGKIYCKAYWRKNFLEILFRKTLYFKFKFAQKSIKRQ